MQRLSLCHGNTKFSILFPWKSRKNLFPGESSDDYNSKEVNTDAETDDRLLAWLLSFPTINLILIKQIRLNALLHTLALHTSNVLSRNRKRVIDLNQQLSFAANVVVHLHKTSTATILHWNLSQKEKRKKNVKRYKNIVVRLVVYLPTLSEPWKSQ